MKWPNHTDYQDAIQNPQVCFEDPQLKAGEAACDMLGLPRVMSGNFASVYELNSGEKRYAVRCFIRQVSGTQGRYARLGQHLGSVSLPCLVGFDFLLKGILVQGEWYPIVKMEWVEGWPLNTYIDSHVNETETLLALARQFRQLVADLRVHKLAHGDFQHGNIMVTPQGALRLVDYDGMYCPAFGKGRSPELGHANFQHPLRMADYYDESLDNFSAVVIYTSLLAIAADPELWKKYYTGDNLIFSSADYRNTHNSKIFEQLKSSSSESARQLSALLQQSCMSSLAFVPWFEDTLRALENGTLLDSIALMRSTAAGNGNRGTDISTMTGPTDSWWENSESLIASGSRSFPLDAPLVSGEKVMGGNNLAGSTQLYTHPSQGATRLSSESSSPGGQSGIHFASAPAIAPSTLPATVQTSIPETDYRPYLPPEELESGMSTRVKIAAAALIVILIIIYAIFNAKPSVTILPPTEHEKEKSQ